MFETRQLDVPAAQSWCSLRDSNAVTFASIISSEFKLHPIAQASGYQDSVAKWITRWRLK
ncbi:unnamed protein product [Schistosoma margrebowiei]|uniref:Uncharacterized protein n=1 Tax=Schistosoma margrebowiei TaxID=48269 RepID=A0A183LE17_9TREM|nr:unnamed protein product [Schistosoma margrebowiei]